MDKSEIKAIKRRISPLDVFIFILVLMCIAGVILRVFVGKDGVLPEVSPEKEEYAVSFSISGAMSSQSGAFTNGERFYCEDGSSFGTLNDRVFTPAVIYTEGEDGKFIVSHSGDDNGDNSLVDIKGTMIVEGYETDYGFLLNGKDYIAPNYSLTLHTAKTTADVKIMDITKISK